MKHPLGFYPKDPTQSNLSTFDTVQSQCVHFSSVETVKSTGNDVSKRRIARVSLKFLLKAASIKS